MKSVTEKLFGINVCTDDVLKKHMPSKWYKNYLKTKEDGLPLSKTIASHVAHAMKTWAIKNGATHYSHWFAPLTGKTAEKQVAFIEPTKKGKVVEEFSAKSLIKGETDASSFPNGGERLTFEARGYTVWDYTSPAFIKDDKSGNKTLFIPTAFCSFVGTALDEKTPLLRALESLNKESTRILHALGYTNVKRVICNIGGEQEYFLIKSKHFNNRLDLKIANRTLLGSAPIKNQEISSHYFGIIEDEISAFMNEVNIELWKLGIMAKLQHNEVAPCQHELVPIFAPANISADQNQLIMETISKTAKRHGMEALFHEKPFNYINGSGKHINWSISTDTGINLLDSNIADKNLFLIFFSSMIKAIDKYYKVIRCSTAHHGNDFRLGGDEAPPTLISVFVGENIEHMFKGKIETSNKKSVLDVGVKSMLKPDKDFCDRNRTSPFAYTTNKFEFRMVGSSQNLSWPCTCICTIMAKVLNEAANKLEAASDKTLEVKKLIKENYENHKRIIFDGNGYDKSWKIEAEKRGLIEYANTTDCFDIYSSEDVIDLFESTKVLNKSELLLRKATIKKAYAEAVKIEALTLCQMVYENVIPSINKYILELANSVKNYAGGKHDSRNKLLEILTTAINELSVLSDKLNNLINKIDTTNITDKTLKTLTDVNTLINNIRTNYDKIEHFIPNNLKPFPTYNDMLFN
ncbi:MAG: glutamine synthetase III [Clostridia bacterium]|nr:glutamine synthetase III [Clostridia bacterium]